MKYGILGAGPSGLTAALFLKSSYEILEKNDVPGGHAGSFIDQGYTFDYGPHIMFSKNKRILKFMIRSLKGNIRQCRRNNKIHYKEKLVKYPFENDLKSLSLEDNYECLMSFLFNPYKEKFKKSRNLEEWLLAHFGKGLCDKYLFPYNRKVWNVPVKKLSMIWADRIPNPSVEDVVKSALGFETEGYAHQLYYHYPLVGGYQAISESLAKNQEVRYGFNVQKITKTKSGTFLVTNGKETRTYDELISTIPIHELIKIARMRIPLKVQKAVKSLIVNPMFVVSLGIKGVDNNQYTAVYFPDEDFLVNRISFPGVFSPHNTPKGHYSIQADITCLKNSATWRKNDADILAWVKQGLIKRRFIRDEKDVVYENIKRVPYAYVVYDTDYEKNTEIIREWFPRQGIHLLGRFSYFEYVNIDGVIARSMEIIGKLNGIKINLSKIKI